MSELAKGHAWKACKAVMAPRVRVPLSPPYKYAVLDGELAVPCNLQSAVAGLMLRLRTLFVGSAQAK